MSKRKAKPRRNDLATTYGRFVLAVAEILELRELPLLSDDERKLLDAAYAFAGDARTAFDNRTGARQAWNDEWADMMKNGVPPVCMVDDNPAPIVAPETAA